MNVGFVLLSYRLDAPAGMERSVAALAEGLHQLGHRPLVLTAAEEPGDRWSIPVPGLRLNLPCDDQELRRVLHGRPELEADLDALYLAEGIDLVCYVDALWGAGSRAPRAPRARSALAVHVVGDGGELCAALDREPDAIVVPSTTVLRQASALGHDPTGWRVVPNGLLVTPPRAEPSLREHLRVRGPVRLVARLGPEKGVAPFLEAAPAPFGRSVEVALAAAGFEAERGGQERLLAECRRAADAMATIALVGPLTWTQVPGFLASAAVAVVPSSAETFGLVALEAASAGTPVVAFAVGHLPDLLGGAADLVDVGKGPEGLWHAVEALLADRGRYRARSAAGRALGARHAARVVAAEWLSAVTA